jgi:hypothetical protein
MLSEARYGSAMPRKGRIDAFGAFHHIIVRGVERREIFKDDTDRNFFGIGWERCSQKPAQNVLHGS